MFGHLSDRQLALLNLPTRKETAALVGWMALANAFGNVTESPVNYGEEIVSRRVREWVGGLSTNCGIRRKKDLRPKQDVLNNQRRKVRVRTSCNELATGRH